ncbi:Uncharacterised protein [Mycobacteroides abscessus subsp. massiliense]|nr:Uncharacterised protein [Mycobacteroides abscessus]SIN34514.1 Uncharacterised protein [Mycobacteroides abscessus subsp. bolletii]SKE63945.1 Uncharacterised protein [Mycobacteroides abscessus subsp. massiliense]SKU51054.1 Uncharacterised protein [Mycobacteroides abscessus subsp. abscessus]CPS49406.1 Uncharacterised protein [Mycobacteroides abscessus]
MVRELDIRVVDDRLENLSVELGKDRPERFGLVYHPTHGLLEQPMLDGPRDSAKHPEVPFGSGTPGFFGKPNI